MTAMQLTLFWTVCLLPGHLALPLSREAADVSALEWDQAQVGGHDVGQFAWGKCIVVGGFQIDIHLQLLQYQQQITQQMDYLRKFYLHDSKTKEANSLVVKLKEMQKFFGLPMTGKLSPQIMEIMQKPRCGVPDVAKYSLMPNSPKWRSREVTYRVISYTSDLPQITVDQIVAKALRMWSKQIPLKFRRVRWGTADIMIDFAKGDHGDSFPFDGPGNTLGHAFAPGPGLGGDAHFDKDEYWTDGNDAGVNFLHAATHEFGHSLGLGHSSDPSAVMYPTYGNGSPKDFRLTKDDIEGIQKLYGKRDDLWKI